MSITSSGGIGRRNLLAGGTGLVAGTAALALSGRGARARENQMSREEYFKYLGHFNNKEYEAFAAYYTPDVVMTYPGGRQVQGPEGIMANYRRLHGYVEEYVEIGDLLIDGDKIACDIYTEFRCFKEYPDFRYGDYDGLKPGDVAKMMNFGMYNLEGGKFKRIRVAIHTFLD